MIVSHSRDDTHNSDISHIRAQISFIYSLHIAHTHSSTASVYILIKLLNLQKLRSTHKTLDKIKGKHETHCEFDECVCVCLFVRETNW